MLLKVVLFAYSKGIISSRGIESACREHVICIALSGDSAPHFTTFAAFVSTLGAEIGPLFKEVLLICDRQGLIGREMFAVDGVKLPSNAAKAKSGTLMRKRDERFKDQAKHKAQPDPLYDKAHPKKTARHYRPQDFTYDPEAGTCLCPAGKSLYQNGANCNHNGHLAVKFQGALRDCQPCTQRDKCLRKPQTTPARQVCFFRGRAPGSAPNYTDVMRRAIDSERGRKLYGGRFATVEPVFGNLRHNKGLDRFTLRGQKKVDAQWKLYCLVHNIEKLVHHGYAQ